MKPQPAKSCCSLSPVTALSGLSSVEDCTVNECEEVERPETTEDLAFLPARDLLALLRARKIGSEELLQIYVERLERLNPPINAIIALDLDRAFEAAREADRHSSGSAPEAPLAGLPMTVKESYGARGMRTSCGLPFLAGNISEEDAVAVGRLRAHGAVIFGKTNIPIGGADHQTDNPIYGLTRNPWSLEHTVGGSSGGSAAALSAGLTPLELGSDIGGSIRIPAHMCGVFGHKSSYGLVPTRGHVPPMPGVEAEPDLAVAGPLARSACDLELAMDILTSSGPERPPAFSTRLAASRHEEFSGFRVALWTHDLPYAASAETVAATMRLAEELRRAGAHVSETARPNFDPQVSLDIYLRTLFTIVLGGQSFELSAAERGNLPEDALYFGRLLEDCAAGKGPGWAALAEARKGLRAHWANFFRDWDVLVCPVFPTAAFRHDLWGEGLGAQLHRRRQVDGKDVVYMSQLSWPSLATVGDLPSTVLPVPRGPGELPLGLQLIGPAMEDRTTIRLAALIERHLGYRAERPPLAARIPAAALSR